MSTVKTIHDVFHVHAVSQVSKIPVATNTWPACFVSRTVMRKGSKYSGRSSNGAVLIFTNKGNNTK